MHYGDQIISIDDIPLEHMTVAEAMQLLRASYKEQIRLEVLPLSQMQQQGLAAIEASPQSPEHFTGKLPKTGVTRITDLRVT